MPKDTFFNLNEEKQEKVIKSAIGEFLDKGYEKGNIGVIAKNAAVAKGSIYQYFENKQELFLYCVRFSIEYLINKYQSRLAPAEVNIFDYFYDSAAQILDQLKDNREITIFIQDVFLGRYGPFTDKSMQVMMSAADAYVQKLIRDGQANGSIRRDIDDKILAMFMTGASMKIKEYILSKAKADDANIIDNYDKYKKDINAMLELLKNGMGEKHVY
jgi:AcrR family transcriptional regulator